MCVRQGAAGCLIHTCSHWQRLRFIHFLMWVDSFSERHTRKGREQVIDGTASKVAVGGLALKASSVVPENK